MIFKPSHAFSKPKFDPTKDYYSILRLPTTAPFSDIKASYYRLAKKYHPDVSKSTEDHFKAINDAYSILSDSQQRTMYDRARTPPSTPPDHSSYAYHYSNTNFNYADRRYQKEQYKYQNHNQYNYYNEEQHNEFYKERNLLMQYSEQKSLHVGLSPIFLTTFLFVFIVEFIFSQLTSGGRSKQTVRIQRQNGQKWMNAEEYQRKKLGEVYQSKVEESQNRLFLLEQEKKK